MNDVCDTWSSAWATLQKALAKTPAHTGVQSGTLGAGSWLGRARHRTEWSPPRDPGSRISARKSARALKYLPQLSPNRHIGEAGSRPEPIGSAYR